MEIADFELERYFARWEFAVAHLLCASDPEPVSLGAMLGPGDHAVVVWPSYQAERVLLLPGSVFGHPGNHVRLGFGRRDLPDALAALTRFAANGSCPLAARPAASR